MAVDVDQLAVYDSQVSEDDAVAVVPSDHEDGSICDEVGSQEYDEMVELDESVFGMVSIATIAVLADHEAPRQIEEIVAALLIPDEERDARCSRSRSAGRSEGVDVEVYVPQLDVDNLPTRIHDPHRQCRLGPEGRPPNARPAPRRARHIDPPVRTRRRMASGREAAASCFRLRRIHHRSGEVIYMNPGVTRAGD